MNYADASPALRPAVLRLREPVEDYGDVSALSVKLDAVAAALAITPPFAAFTGGHREKLNRLLEFAGAKAIAGRARYLYGVSRGYSEDPDIGDVNAAIRSLSAGLIARYLSKPRRPRMKRLFFDV